MRERRWLLLALYGLLLATAVAGALKATRPKFKIATTSTTTTTTEEPDVADNENGENEATTISSDVNATTGRTLTGIPQIDYIWDPNLPRELNGFNLSDYPFYSGIPEEITFKCDGLHDGFYASVAHKCQVYHHCLYGTRYDFLCANFTAFDQRTFICHFASEVDCANSKKHWHRNDALYKTAETTTTSTSTTSTTSVPPPPARRPGRISARRPLRRRPAYDYYEEDYYDDEPGYERTRPRGYDRRDDYDYDDRKYTRRDRERDRDFRDRDYRDRDLPRQRESDRPLRDSERPSKDERETHLSPRERFPVRNNRRDPPRSTTLAPREDNEPRNRNRDQEPAPIARPRDPELEVNEKKDSRNRGVDDRRYSDKGFRDDYEDEPIATGPGSTAAAAGPEVFVKPSAPVSSVYARPRTPPKIRRPVPLAEQEKFSYKVTSAPQTTGEARRRPTEASPIDEDYYEDEVEEVRPRRPMKRIRRPGFRDYYENPRERERDRDRPFRPRYRDEEEDTRPRKHQDRNRNEEDNARPRKHPERNRNSGGDDDDDDDGTRPRKHGERNRERYYERGPERGRDRSLDRPKEHANGARHQESERPDKPMSVRDHKDNERTRPSMKPKEPSEVPESTRRPNVYDRTSVSPPTTSTEPPKESAPSHQISHETAPEITEKQRNEPEEYSSDDYYDEPEYQQPPPPPPRTAVRIVKRPFLPSRGGNPNPRGLSPVGLKASEPPRREETINDNDKRTYDAYKFIQTDVGQKSRPDDYEGVLTRPTLRKPDDERVRTVVRRPIEENEEESGQSKGDDNSAALRNIGKGIINNNNEEDSQSKNEDSSPARAASGRGSNQEETPNDRDKSVLKWNSDEYRQGQRGDVRHDNNENNSGGENRGKQARVSVTENSGYYSDTYANDNNDRDSPTGPPGNNKPIINEVVTHHRLQDIPESEYDVTLNEALTPAFSNQEGNLPSGFVLPIHRQLARDPVLQSTENSYKVSRPYNQQSQQPQQQQQQQQQQKTFVPSPQFLPLTEIGSANNNDRSRSVQYFRTPEAVHVTGPQYRHQRGPWHDYTGY